MVVMKSDAPTAQTTQYANPALRRNYAAGSLNNNFSALFLMIMVSVGLDMHWTWIGAAFIVWVIDRVGCSGAPSS